MCELTLFSCVLSPLSIVQAGLTFRDEAGRQSLLHHIGICERGQSKVREAIAAQSSSDEGFSQVGVFCH